MKREFTDSQKRAITGRGNLLVSASAGSGKTTVMVERIVRYIASGGEIDKIVVITFTRASAADMKEKLLEGLYKAIRTGECGGRSLDAKQTAHIARQIPRAAFSYISTIDGFCAEIYRRYFEDIGGEPAITVLDENKAELIFDLASDEVLNEYLSSGDPEFFELSELFTERRGLDTLKDVIKTIHKFVSVQEDPESFFDAAVRNADLPLESSPAAEYYLRYARRKFNASRAEAENILKSFAMLGGNGLDKLRVEIENLRDIFDNLSLTDGAESLARCLAGITIERKPAKRNLEGPLEALQEDARSFFDNAREFIRDIREKLLPEPKNATASYEILKERDAAARAVNAKLIEVARAVRERYAELKKKEGAADFADLEHFALKILNNKARAEEIASQIEFIFMDEYQDTNYLQEAVIGRIARDNVFMVGDVKQSIYKFRFAEPKIFLDKEERFRRGAGGSEVSLNKNFRSSAEILKFVNLLFSEIMTYSFGGVDYRKDAAFDIKTEIGEKGVESDPSLPSVRIAFFEKQKAEAKPVPPVYSVRDGELKAEEESREAVYIADRIEEIVGKVKVFAGDPQKERIATYGDIAILMRSKKGEAIRAELKKRGIPFSAPGFSGTAEYYDIELLVSLLRVIDNFRIDIPLYAVMRSFFGGFKEAELAEIRGADKSGFFWGAVENFSGRAELKEKIDCFIKTLNRYRRLSQATEAAELLSLIIAETGFDGYLLSRDESERTAYVNAFIHNLQAKGGGIREALAEYDASGPPEFSPSAGDAVGFYSIHKSKGLEFPVVFLACAQQGMNKRETSGKNILLDKDLGIALKWRDSGNKTKGDTLPLYGFKVKAEHEEREELLRMLYVAMTRARFHLFITGEKGKDVTVPSVPEDGGRFIEWIEYAARQNDTVYGYYEKDVPEGKYIPGKKEPPVLIDAPALDLELKYPHADTLSISAKYTVSQLNRAESDTVEFGYVPFLDDKAAERGTAYHTFMEFADFNITDPEGIREEIRSLAAEGILEGSEHLDAELLSSVLKNPLFDAARKGSVLREKPFILYLPAREVLDTASEEKTLIQGVIDLLITGEENILVDYKFTRADPEEVKERYREQLLLYEKAAAILMNIKPDKKIIFIINRNLAIEV